LQSLHRVSLQHWQKLQSGQEFFLKAGFFSIFYYMPAGPKGQRMREYELSQAGRMWYFN
jgi:hypothetical protein